VRILVPTQQWFPDRTGGAARVARATAAGLAARGHEVVVLSPRFADEPTHSTVDGVEVRRVIRRGALPLTATDPIQIKRQIRAIENQQFDVVLAHGHSSVIGASAALPQVPIVYVFQASGFLEARFRRSGELSLVEKARSLAVEPMLFWLERSAARRASRIIVMSRFSQGVLAETQPSAEAKTSVVWGGVDMTDFSPAADRPAIREQLRVLPQQTLLLTARRLVSRMGIDVLLCAFARLREHNTSLRLVIIGDGELKSTLEAERDRLKLRDWVDFTGRISEQELRHWYQVADLFVLPTVAYEGFGMVTAEALACGTPVVGTRVGATGELLEPLDPNLLSAAPTADALADTIRQTLTHIGPEFRSTCRSYAERELSWDSALDRWEMALVDPTK
jgi:glycosyltransferase involved in cell wall biosynthesis